MHCDSDLPGKRASRYNCRRQRWATGRALGRQPACSERREARTPPRRASGAAHTSSTSVGRTQLLAAYIYSLTLVEVYSSRFENPRRASSIHRRWPSATCWRRATRRPTCTTTRTCGRRTRTRWRPSTRCSRGRRRRREGDGPRARRHVLDLLHLAREHAEEHGRRLLHRAAFWPS